MADARRLPIPVSEQWDWQLQAACQGKDEVFFHPDGERGRDRARREALAKEICTSCPVLLTCRRHALETGEPYGTWGGLSERDRAAATNDRR